MIIFTGCSQDISAQPIEMDSATNTPTVTLLFEEYKPVETPSPTPTPAPNYPIFELANKAFIHKQGLFNFIPPQDWVTEEQDFGVTFRYLDGPEIIIIGMFNTGIDLNETEITRFIDAREDKLFAESVEPINDYAPPDSSSHRISRIKTISTEGAMLTARSTYIIDNQIITTIDIIAEDVVYEGNLQFFEAISKQLYINSEQSKLIPMFYQSWSYYCPIINCSVDIPTGWKHVHNESEFTVVDSFYSPDEHATIQYAFYDDGEEMNKTLAGAFALVLLKNYYADDIWISSDNILPDGRERLVWNSVSQTFRGTSYFSNVGTTFSMLSFIHDDDFEEQYGSVLLKVAESYRVQD